MSGARRRIGHPGGRPGVWLLVALWLAGPAAGFAQQPKQPRPTEPGQVKVTVEPDRSEVKLGEPVRLTIHIQGAADNQSWRLPDSLDLGPFVELGRDRRSSSTAGSAGQVLHLKVAAFEDLGPQEIKGIRLVPDADAATGGELTVPPVKVKVLSVLEGVADATPRDVAGPLSVVVPDYRLGVVLGLVGLWLLLALVLRRQRAPLQAAARLQELPPPRQAHEIALERLQGILDDDLLRQGGFHEYFKRISETTREYLGNRYTFFALDLTTAELIADLRDRITPGLDLAGLQQLLEDCDLVKFARFQPDAAMCSNAINATFALVEATRVRDEAAPAGAAA